MNEFRLVRFFLSGNYSRLAVSWVMGLAGVGLAVVFPQQIARLTNLFSGDQAPNWETVHLAILYLIASQLGVSIVGYWKRKLEAQLHVSMVRNLTLTLYTRVLRFSADFFQDREVERINTRALEDSERVATLWMEGVLGVPLALVSIVVFAAWMLAANWFLGACMIPLSLLSGYFLFFDRHIQTLNAQDRETRDNIRTQANQTIGAAAEFRHHFAFDYGLGPLRQSFSDFQRLMTRMGNLMALFQALSPFIATLQIGVLTWLGAALVLGEFPGLAFAGRLTWGEVVGFMLLLQLFQRPVSDVTSFVLRWRIARESFQRVEEFLERPQAFEPAGNEPAVPPGPVALSFDRVDVKAPSGAPILNGVELQIAPGTHVAFVGPSGSGKSTLIKLIVREFEPSQGRLALNARAVEDYHGESLARTVGFVPQRPVLMNASIRNNILLGLRRSSGRVLQDAAGPIDVSGLESVQGPADLDRELVRMVRLVGLESDVLRKALDNPLPPGWGPSPLRTRVGELRAAVADRLKETAANDFVPFEQDRYLPGPLMDNLVWVGLGRSESPSAVAARLLDSLSGEDLVEQMLEFWRRTLLSDQSLRARAVLRAPRLLEFLPSRPSALDGGEALTRYRNVPLTALPRHLRLSLVESALGGDSVAARKMFAKDNFPQRILAVRRVIAAKNPGWPGCWRAIGQDEFLPSLTLRENLLGGRADLQRLGAAERVDRAIQEVLQTRDLMTEALLAGLEFVVGESGKYLSGGQAQKTAIARVLLKNPSLLLLDEATAALDELSQAQITEMVRREFAGRTVVSVSHRLSTIRHADHIAVLDHGQVAQEGNYEELASREGIFRELIRHEGEEPRRAEAPAPAEVAAARSVMGEDGARLCHQIARCPLFAHMTCDNHEFLERLVKEVRCAQGEVLFHAGDPGTDFYLILEGEVDFVAERQAENGVRREVVTSDGPGGFFGELALFGAGRRSLGAVARTDLHLCVLRRDDLLGLLAADPQIAVGLLRAMATRLTQATVQLFGKPPNA